MLCAATFMVFGFTETDQLTQPGLWLDANFHTALPLWLLCYAVFLIDSKFLVGREVSEG